MSEDRRRQLNDADIEGVVRRVVEHPSFQGALDARIDEVFEDRLYVFVGKRVVKSFIVLGGAIGAAVAVLVHLLQGKGVL
jgi:hypothetical protein